MGGEKKKHKKCNNFMSDMDRIAIRLNPIDYHHIPNNRLLLLVSTHRTIINHILGNKTSSRKFQKIENI